MDGETTTLDSYYLTKCPDIYDEEFLMDPLVITHVTLSNLAAAKSLDYVSRMKLPSAFPFPKPCKGPDDSLHHHDCECMIEVDVSCMYICFYLSHHSQHKPHLSAMVQDQYTFTYSHCCLTCAATHPHTYIPFHLSGIKAREHTYPYTFRATRICSHPYASPRKPGNG